MSISRRKAITEVLSENLPEMRSAEFAAALTADGQAELFPETRLTVRSRPEVTATLLFDEAQP